MNHESGESEAQVSDETEAVEVRPLKNGKLKVSGVSESFDDLASAHRAARLEAGSVEAFDKDGTSLGFTHPVRAIRLFRQDGSTYGELGASSPRTAAAPIEVSLEAAVIDNRAEELA